jgi:hypothetical protein
LQLTTNKTKKPNSLLLCTETWYIKGFSSKRVVMQVSKFTWVYLISQVYLWKFLDVTLKYAKWRYPLRMKLLYYTKWSYYIIQNEATILYKLANKFIQESRRARKKHGWSLKNFFNLCKRSSKQYVWSCDNSHFEQSSIIWVFIVMRDKRFN